MDIPLSVAIKFFGLSCSSVFLAEVIPSPSQDMALITELGKLTLVSVLAFAVIVLWRAFVAEKDARIKEVAIEKDARIKQAEEFTQFLRTIHQQRELEIKGRDHA